MIIMLTVTHPVLFSRSSAASQLLCFSFLSHKECFYIKRMSENVTFYFAFECGFIFQTNIQLSKVQPAGSIYFSSYHKSHVRT